MSSVSSPIKPADQVAPARGGAGAGAAIAQRMMLPLDPLLTLAVLGLMACSLVVIAGATKDDVPGQPDFYLFRQAIYAVAGIIIMLLISRFDYSRLREMKYGIYGFLIGSIVLVFVLATATRGSRRWIELPFFNFQPSELGKVLLLLVLAAVLVDQSRNLSAGRTTARVLLLALIPAGLVMLQPDLGTALVYVAGGIAVLFVAGVSWKHFAALAALGAVTVGLVLVALPAVGVEALKPYQQERLTAFLNPSDDPGDAGYQQNQSRIAIGSGQKTGRGAEKASQTRLNFLPEHHTDFIFAVVGEEYGFAGAALVLSLYALLIWRGLRILTMAKNLYGAIVAGGIVCIVLWQLFVNVGMTIGIMPITGVPLPLLSYGGGSVLATFVAVGLLQSIYVQGRMATRSKRGGAIAL